MRNWNWRRAGKNTYTRTRIRMGPVDKYRNVGSTNQISVTGKEYANVTAVFQAATVIWLYIEACYERTGYRELWPKHELAAKLFSCL